MPVRDGRTADAAAGARCPAIAAAAAAPARIHSGWLFAGQRRREQGIKPHPRLARAALPAAAAAAGKPGYPDSCPPRRAGQRNLRAGTIVCLRPAGGRMAAAIQGTTSRVNIKRHCQ